jgi:hypothetical protein
MAKKKKKKSTWAQRVGKRMNRRQKARQAVKLAEAGVDPTSIGGFGKRKGRKGGGGGEVIGPVPGPDWSEFVLPAAVLGGLALVLTRKDSGK